MVMTRDESRLLVLKRLQLILRRATQVGLLDELPPLCANPDSVNDFCDAVNDLNKETTSGK